MPLTRIAVAGAGLIGQSHVAAIQNEPSAALAAIVDPSAASQALALRVGVPHFATLEDMIESVERGALLVDGVVLATPNALHLTHALLCLRAGLPMLLEKPVTASVDEGKRLVEAARAANALDRILVGHHRAHSAIMDLACRTVQSGRLGRIVAVQGSAAFLKPDHYFVDAPWRKAKGAGPMLINMIHEVHNLRMLCGEVVQVQAVASHAVRGFEVEDTVAMTLAFEGGALASFLLSDTAASARSWEHTSGENKAYPQHGDEDCYVVMGTDGSLAIPSMRIKRYASVDDRSWWKPFETSVLSLESADPLQRQMAHFAAMVRGEVKPKVSVLDGVTNLRVVEALVASSKTGAAVSLKT